MGMNRINKFLAIATFYFTIVTPSTVSVTTFKNNTPNPEKIWIGEMIADNLTSDLLKVEDINLINRNHLKEILKEQKLQYSGMMNEEGQVDLGKLVGASKILKGDYTILSGILIINAVLVDVETGRTEKSTKVEGNTGDIYVLVKQLTMKVLVDLLDIKLEEIEKLKIFKYDTDKVNAIEKNYLGILALEQDSLESAISLFRQALTIDPQYFVAKNNLRNTQLKINGTSLLSKVLDINERKRKQKVALKPIIDDFMKNYINVNVIGIDVITDSNQPEEAFIELKIEINHDINALEKFIYNLLEISDGDVPLVSKKQGDYYKITLLPQSLAYMWPSKIFNSLFLFADNVNWAYKYIFGDDYSFPLDWKLLRNGIYGYEVGFSVNVIKSEKIEKNTAITNDFFLEDIKVGLAFDTELTDRDFSINSPPIIIYNYSFDDLIAPKEKYASPVGPNSYKTKFPVYDYIYIRTKVEELEAITGYEIQRNELD
tara:strand:- start:233 stop:1690 length:1458 start_codon:yes stop_codon:yes gene_type:complete